MPIFVGPASTKTYFAIDKITVFRVGVQFSLTRIVGLLYVDPGYGWHPYAVTTAMAAEGIRTKHDDKMRISILPKQ